MNSALVFQKGCIDHTFHPLWGKIYGYPQKPSAAVVLGERGSGKTALRFQIVEHLRRFNQTNPDAGVLVLEYHDFNPFLDAFCRNGADLAEWGLRDHMDAILSLGTRRVVDAILGKKDGADQVTSEHLTRLDAQQRRDLLLLAVMYDHSDSATRTERCRHLGRALGYPGLFQRLAATQEATFGLCLTALLGILAAWLLPPLIILALLAWTPYLRRWLWARRLAAEISKHIRVLPHDAAELRRILLKLRRRDLEEQPVSRLNDSDARYKLLSKLIEVGKQLGFAGIVVVVDRVDEPDRVKSDTDRMFLLMRSIFDLKFLKHDNVGVKLLLPAELYRPIQKQLDENIARLDKQNFIRSLEWTGASLHDLINARLQACAVAGDRRVTLRSLLDDAISDDDVMSCLEKLKIPRHAFKFMDRMIAKHCQAHTDERPAWKIGRDTFVESRTDFLRVVEDYERGLLAS